jgi:hypothetical protein
MEWARSETKSFIVVYETVMGTRQSDGELKNLAACHALFVNRSFFLQ